MNIKAKLKSVNFWTAIAGAIVMLLRAFGIEMGGEEIEMAISSVASILVLSGILVDTKVKTTTNTTENSVQTIEALNNENLSKNDKNSDANTITND